MFFFWRISRMIYYTIWFNLINRPFTFQPLFYTSNSQTYNDWIFLSFYFRWCTQLLLGYLPVEKDAWEVELTNNRLRYADLKAELLVNPVSTIWEETLHASSNQMNFCVTVSFPCAVFTLSFTWPWLFELLEPLVSDLFLINLNVLFSQSALSRKEGRFSLSDQVRKRDADGPLYRRDLSNGDHPLSVDSASIWHQYFKVNNAP